MEFFTQPWPWYVTGPLIGLMVPVLLIFGNKHFGISSTMRHICAACISTKNPFFNYDWKKEIWTLVLVVGIIIGGFVGNNFMSKENKSLDLSAKTEIMFEDWNLFYGESKEVHSYNHEGGEMVNRTTEQHVLMPSEIFSFDSFASPIGWIFMALGGFLVGFGTRWANGCTSGHAIMGLSLLNLGSLIAVIGFFIGGLIVSWFVIPALL